jgi:isovaleryl-CoA dehydrogenase
MYGGTVDDDIRAAFARIVDEIVTPGAAEVDRAGRFPAEAVQALGEAGVLGLTTATGVGGAGAGLRDAAEVVQRLAASCGSTAMVVLMHYAAVALIEAHGSEKVRREIAEGRHLSTLAFSEAGSRSHFWVPLGTATADGPVVRLSARKSWVTAAGHARSYVWSSRAMAADGPMTLWLVPSDAEGLAVAAAGFDGLGLRGNDSRPVTADGVPVAADAMLGADGAGLDAALGVALPWFLVLSAAFSVGLMQSTVDETAGHLVATRLTHLGQSLADQPVSRLELGRMRLALDAARAALAQTLTAVETGAPDATPQVLGVKAICGESAAAVTDAALRVCGGAAFRRELALERRFRDARAARVMAPTSDALTDFVARLTCGLPLFDGAPS